MRFFKKISQPTELLDQMMDDATNKIHGLLESIYADREADAQNSQFAAGDVPSIIKEYTQKNMAISAAAAAVPGPAGALTFLPEMIATLGNQMAMVYDIGCAFDKEDFLNKDSLLEIPLQAMGGSTNLSQLQEAENLLDSPIDALKEKAQALAKTLIEKQTKKSLLRMIPVAGPVFMGIWSSKSTKNTADIAMRFFNPKMVLESSMPNVANEIALEKEQIKMLIQILVVDNEGHEEELEYMKIIISDSRLEQSEKDKLWASCTDFKAATPADINLLSSDQIGLKDLISDMMLLAHRDDHLNALELDYIVEFAKKVEVEKGYVNELLNSFS